MLRRWIRKLTVLVALAAPMLALSPAAHATIVERGEFAGTDTGSFDDCGFQIDSIFEFSGRFWIRADGKEGTSQAFFGNSQFEFREVLTNHDTGEWFVVRGDFLFKDVKATQVEGNVYRFRQHQAGQPFVVEDSTGNVVVRDRGLIVFDQLFDTLGDDAPGGEELSVDVQAVHGPHPGFAEDFDFCALARELIG